MAKMRSLIKLLKRLLKSEPKKKHEQVQREKRRKWVFGRLKWRRLPVLEVGNQRRLSDAEEEHTRHALTAAVATAAAAEAAVAAAQAAAEVVRLTRTTRSYRQSPRRSRDLAALKIQTAYRGYLARKALRALKGLVKLQALVRGQAVRRQAEMTLKGLQTIVKIQSEVRARRTRTGKVHSLTQEKEPEDKETQLQLSSFRGWDDSLQTKEDVDATMVGRQEALIKRERIKEYIMNLRERRNATQLDESEEDNKVNGCLTQWLEQWVDAHEQKSGRDFIICSNIMQSNVEGRMELRMREIEDCEQKNAVSPPRRSFDRSKRRSNGGHQSLDSPAVPNYMSATESARARLRSSSMPKQREGLMLDTFLNRGSPSKNRSSFSINSDGSTSFMSRKAPVSEQRSPCMKSASSPIKPFLIAKDFD